MRMFEKSKALRFVFRGFVVSEVLWRHFDLSCYLPRLATRLIDW
jgi:hypothetical protein